jgi:hypothetical protein
MTTKIAALDAQAMNQLYASELAKDGVKTAAGENLQAFDDHKSYVATLESILSNDKKDGWKPNDPTLD